MSVSALGWLALVPLVTGPLPEESRALTVALCGGGEITIPIDGEQEPPAPCDAKACHASNCRKQFDRGQLPPAP